MGVSAILMSVPHPQSSRKVKATVYKPSIQTMEEVIKTPSKKVRNEEDMIHILSTGGRKQEQKEEDKKTEFSLYYEHDIILSK